MNDTPAEVRLDRWLWAARIYRTRSLATAAVKGGRIQVAGQRAKAARLVRIGDRIRVSRENGRVELIVTGLSDKRGPAKVALTLYQETPESIERRASEREGRRVERAAAPAHKPDKKGRRQLRRLMRGD